MDTSVVEKVRLFKFKLGFNVFSSEYKLPSMRK